LFINTITISYDRRSPSPSYLNLPPRQQVQVDNPKSYEFSRYNVPNKSSFSTSYPSTSSSQAIVASSTPHTAYNARQSSLDNVLNRARKTLQQNAALRDKTDINATFKTDLNISYPEKSFDLNGLNGHSTSSTYKESKKDYEDWASSQELVRLLEINRKQYKELMQKLEDADNRLMLNKERYMEVKDSLAGALQRIKNLEDAPRSSTTYAAPKITPTFTIPKSPSTTFNIPKSSSTYSISKSPSTVADLDAFRPSRSIHYFLRLCLIVL
jgi:hypothetical protein